MPTNLTMYFLTFVWVFVYKRAYRTNIVRQEQCFSQFGISNYNFRLVSSS
jgi:hypothetical protein